MLLQKLTKLNFDITTVALKLFWPFVLCFSCRGKPLKRIWGSFDYFQTEARARASPGRKEGLSGSPLF
jgi:hypothetical protein